MRVWHFLVAWTVIAVAVIVGLVVADTAADGDTPDTGWIDLRSVYDAIPNIHHGCADGVGYSAFVNANKYDVITLRVVPAECGTWEWPTGTLPLDCFDGCATPWEPERRNDA